MFFAFNDLELLAADEITVHPQSPNSSDLCVAILVDRPPS